MKGYRPIKRAALKRNLEGEEGESEKLNGGRIQIKLTKPSLPLATAAPLSG